MGNPQPAEGALVTRELLKERRCFQQSPPACPPARKAAVAVDPSGGGRDTAGVVGGYLGTDGRLYFSHDRSRAMSSEQWSREACVLAVDIDADRIIVESNYGGDMASLAVRTAWDVLRREELDTLRGDTPAEEYERTDAYQANARYARLPPRIVVVHARKNTLLRAEPIGQQWIVDRIRTAAYLPEFEEEWATWQPDSTDSPGRIDAGVYLAYGLLPPPPLSGGATPPPRGNLPTTGLGPLGGR
jgi:phage terminase large subunit-like protein